MTGLSREQLVRFSRHIFLPEVGVDGQQRIVAARVLIVGMGGLGCPVSMYLAAAGVGTLVICDDDVVEASNLQRQIAYSPPQIGRHKVDAAADILKQLNPELVLIGVKQRLVGAELLAQVAAADVVVDATDNFPSRFALNQACVQARRPLVSGAAVQFAGQVSVFRSDLPQRPCYRCLYPEEVAPGEGGNCAQAGVFAPVVGIVASTQAVEVLKLLVGIGEVLDGRLLRLDALAMTWRSAAFGRDPACPVCGTG